MEIKKDELNIYEVEALSAELVEALKGDELIIDMSSVNRVDMSTIQLFISTKKSCDEVSKKFELQNVNPEVATIFKSCACDFLLGDTDD
ncbi:MAG: STAS domain-containing protein [Campylobacterota bacterium]|nr:STAS domain-containing protein [Campylobacterota bacterium]